MPVQNTIPDNKYFDGHPMSQMQNINSVNGPQQTQQFKGQPMNQQMSGQQFAPSNQNTLMVQNQNQNQNQNPGMNNMQSINQLNPSTPQMMPSPSGYAPSPSPMMPSPHSNLIRPSGPMSAPSPQSISLNTPGASILESIIYTVLNYCLYLKPIL
jgi:hypothetical protein